MTDTQSLPKAERPIVYVRPVDVADLPPAVRDRIGSDDPVFAIVSEDGNTLGIARNRAMAFNLARMNELVPQSVH